MENVQEKCLTLEDKAKIKERLALLKKEYKRTVNRLQKSERAERVKSHVKRTIEEQNRLLSQEYIGQDSVLLSSGPENCRSNISGDLGELHKTIGTPSADKQRKPCVSFNLEPEIVNSGSRTPPYSGGESSGQEAEGNQAHPSSQTSRSRLRLSRSARRVCFSESPSPSVFRVGSIVNVVDGKESPVDKSLSPVFKKHSTDGAPLRPDNATASYCSEDTKPADVVHDIVGPSGTALFRLGIADNSPGDVKSNYDSLQSVGAENTAPNELLEYNMDSVSNKSEAKEDKPLPTSKSLDVETTCESTCGLLVTPPRAPELENHTDVKTTSEASPPPSSQNQTLPHCKSHAESAVIEEGHNPLSSCTLVEGLLFPVEYYVRTTRRMTSCQRKVDLDAVISSHLATGRRGLRGRPRRNSTSLSTPVHAGDKLSNSLTPLSRPSVSNSAGEVTRSRRGRGRKSCPAVISSGLKDVSVQLTFGAENSLSLSEKENCDEASASKELQKAMKCLTNITDGSQMKDERCMTLMSDKKAYSLRSQKAVLFNVLTSAGDEDDKLCNFRSLKEASGPIGSPLPLLSGRVSLDHLAQCLKITDFHLPDEEFGILKLEKLKSVNHLERFTPHASKGRRESSQHPENDSSTLPCTGSSVVLQKVQHYGATCTFPCTGSSVVLQEVDLGACPQKSERALKLLEHCSNVDLLPCSKENTLENEQSANVAEAPHSTVSEPTKAQLSQLSPVISGVSAHKENTAHSPQKDILFSPSPGHTGSFPVRSHPDNEIPHTVFPNPPGFLNDSEVQAYIPVTGVLGAAENLGANLNLLRSVEFDDVPKDSKMPRKTSSPKEMNSSVLFSTSLCSVPLESMNDLVASSCTPGLPYLGSTPAAFSSPKGSNTLVACSPADEEQQKAPSPEVRGEGPEFMSLSCLNVTGDPEDTKQCHDVLGPDINTVVAGQCEYLESQEKSPMSTTDKDRSVHVISEGPNKEDTEVETVAGGHLRLLSEVKDSCGGGCAADLCPVWWEFSGSTELCIVAASESSVCLWRPQAEGTWECAHMWSFTEMPVIQILPLSQEKNIVCVALGNLEILEIWALFSSPQRLGWEKKLVKRGHMKTAQGLSRHRVVSSGSGEDGQVLQVKQLSETGCTMESIALAPPRDIVLTFCEVEGERDALVGSTMDNYVVIWNAVTGHLLSAVCMADHCSDLYCLSATSDSGLLFLVVGSLFSKPCEDGGSCILKLIATNPQRGTSALIMNYLIPDKPHSRYLEGDVKRQKAAAVLTCGSIALWDLLGSHCSVTLPPSMDAPWCLVRWSLSPSRLLTGKKDGTICIYEYTEHCSNKRR